MAPFVEIKAPRRDGAYWIVEARINVPGGDDVNLTVRASDALLQRAKGYAMQQVQFAGPYALNLYRRIPQSHWPHSSFSPWGDSFQGEGFPLMGPHRQSSEFGGPLYLNMYRGIPKKYRSREQHMNSFGPHPVDSFAGIFDDIVDAVSSVAKSPILAAIPFVGTVATAVGAATDIYKGVRGPVGPDGTPAPARPRELHHQYTATVRGKRATFDSVAAMQRWTKIQRDAAKGHPEAKKALRAVKQVAQADRIFQAAKRGNSKARGFMQNMMHRASQGDLQAVEAVTIFQQLDRDPVDLDVDADQYDTADDMAGDIIGAIAQVKRIPFPTKAIAASQLTDHYRKILSKYAKQAARRAH